MLKIEFARPEDDSSIRDIMRDTKMESMISLVFDRHPSYFGSLHLDGHDYSTIVGRDTEGKTQGFGTCVFRHAYINGKIHEIGYLHNLRLRKAYRDGYSVALGYKKFREVVNSRNSYCYVTSIMSSNKEAIAILTSGKGGLPSYLHLCKYNTYVIRSGVTKNTDNSTLNCLSAPDSAEIQRFTEAYAVKHNFLPAPGCNIYSGSKLMAIENNGAISGLAGLWSISDSKRLLIADYSSFLKILKPFYNALTAVNRKPSLPELNKPVKYSYIFPMMLDNCSDNEAFTLINKLSVMSGENGDSFFIAGCPAGSRAETILSAYPNLRLTSDIFIVDWNKDINSDDITSNSLHIEVGIL